MPKRRRRLRAVLVRKLRGLARRYRAPLAAVLVLFLVACVAEEVETTRRQPDALPVPELTGEPTIRVQLLENQKQIKVSVNGPCRIVPSTGEPLFPDKLDETLVVVDEGSLGIKVGDKVFFGAQEVRFAPSPGAVVKVETKSYKGDVVIKLQQGVLLKAIDFVGAEDYVAGVLPGEVSLSWPEAAVKAQSVAARTYGIWHWKKSQLQDHDVFADTRSQVYNGIASESIERKSHAITAATQGKVLTYNSVIFETFFFAACGGETANADWVFGGPSVAPLQGAKCGYCATCPHAVWERKITQAELVKALAGYGVKGHIEGLETIPWPRGGYIHEVKVRFTGGETSVPGTKFRFAFTPPLKSACFEVSGSGDTLVVAGRGWGHGVGLCQWGAKGCADTGMSEDQILNLYYPSAEILKLY